MPFVYVVFTVLGLAATTAHQDPARLAKTVGITGVLATAFVNTEDHSAWTQFFLVCGATVASPTATAAAASRRQAAACTRLPEARHQRPRGLVRAVRGPWDVRAITSFDLERGGYFIAAMNACHALAGTLRVAPARSLVSRTITASAALATSTHSPPFAPE